MNIDILKICLDLRHVEIHGFEKADVDARVNVLKEKSLVSIFITPSPVFDINQHSKGLIVVGSLNHISDMTRKCPRLRSLHVQRFLTDWSSANSLMLDMSDACGCCPDVHESIFTGNMLNTNNLRLLRIMCTGSVTNLLSYRISTWVQKMEQV